MTYEKSSNDEPQGTAYNLNEPNFELMARALLNLYYKVKKSNKADKTESA